MRHATQRGPRLGAIHLVAASRPVWACFLLRLGVLQLCVLQLVGCNNDRAPEDASVTTSDAGPAITDSAADGGGIVGDGAAPVETCTPIQGAEHLPATTAAMTAPSGDGRVQYRTADLFRRFNDGCAGSRCHGVGGSGALLVPPGDLDAFVAQVGQSTIDRVESSTPGLIMPPTDTRAFDTLPPGDLRRQLSTLLRDWVAAGKPTDQFETSAAAGPSSLRYVLTPEVGMALTNIGNCAPSGPSVNSQVEAMREIDARFAAMAQNSDLPERLSETDLIALDSEVLGQYGVFSYATNYPLWSDDSRKMRYVRVPVGESVRFMAEGTVHERTGSDREDFLIPANTRFYKTFIKPVLDPETGETRYRKIETRLIVVRPNRVRVDANGEPVFDETDVTALYATYQWNEDETEAIRLDTPLRDEDPNQFADEITSYIVGMNAPNGAESGEERHYAIPGSIRCLQCHMGSPDQSFALGFTPLQLLRRPTGEGGTIDPVGTDELGQIERLVRWGVLTGLTSGSDITPLEASQGDRAPRNDYELKAQGYLLGNCAHCHNTNGYPSVTAIDELGELLNFQPGTAEGHGVFQFPLERYSPRVRRGVLRDIPVPYITPSVYDLWRPFLAEDVRGESTVEAAIEVSGQLVDSADETYWRLTCRNPASGQSTTRPVPAPWRSLIWRNVDATFPYSNYGAIYPRMPLHTAGYDCNVGRIMAEWMLSIPSRLKIGTGARTNWEKDNEPAIRERNNYFFGGVQVSNVLSLTDAAQPHEEVRPNEADYQLALTRAESRLELYRSGPRYSYCPSSPDIFYPVIANAPAGQDTLDIDRANRPYSTYNWEPLQEGTCRQDAPDGVPDQPHWVVLDPTDPPTWSPRNASWVDAFSAADPTPAVAALKSMELTDELRSFALERVPFGLWAVRPECDYSSEPTAGELTGPDQPDWFTNPTVGGDPVAPPAADAPVYMVQRGAAVFQEICVNCHGRQANGQTSLASTMSLVSGGQVRVANFRDGLFGPTDMPGSHAESVFGSEQQTARYLGWMALGGTQVTLPPAVLQQVANLPVMGEQRGGVPITANANMLGAAQELCDRFAGDSSMKSYTFDVARGRTYQVRTSSAGGQANKRDEVTGLIDSNGDTELWRDVCFYENPLPAIRVVDWGYQESGTARVPGFYFTRSWYPRSADALMPGSGPTGVPVQTYPSDAPIGDEMGNVVIGLSDDNAAPWCVHRPRDAAEEQLAQAWWETHSDVATVPWCPDFVDTWYNADLARVGSELNRMFFYGTPAPALVGIQQYQPERAQWALRGAVNAAFMVYSYLNAMMRHEAGGEVLAPYNECPLN